MPHLPACKITTFTFMKIIKETIKGVQDVLWVNKWFWVVLKKGGFVLFDKYVSWIFIKPLPCSSKFLQICKKKNTIFAFLLEPNEQLVPVILGGPSDQEPRYKTNSFWLLKFQFQDRYSKYSIQCVLCCGGRTKRGSDKFLTPRLCGASRRSNDASWQTNYSVQHVAAFLLQTVETIKSPLFSAES